MTRHSSALQLAALAGAAGIAGIAGIVAITGCAREKPRPPIVLISIDTLRSDRLPTYGYASGSTPAIDALARDAIVFERAFSEAPLTLPAHASLFSGEIPPRHGVRDNFGFEAPESSRPWLAERLKNAGYATFGAVSARVLARRTGISRGFDSWDEPGAESASPAVPLSPAPPALPPVAERAGGTALAAAKRWLSSRMAGEPAPPFLFVHFYEPHAPYLPPEPYRSRLADSYDGEIAAADALVGELIADLRSRGLYDSSILVLLSDHGEGLGEHGEAEHGILLNREALQVPLVVKLPGQARAGERIPRNVGLIDVLPTLLELLELPTADPLDGISLLARDLPLDRALYAETIYPRIHFGWSDLASVVAGNLHLIHGRRSELFDLALDPAETIDTSDANRMSLAAMRRFLAGIDRTLAPAAPAAQPAPVAGSSPTDAEALRSLAALGYLGASAAPEAGADLPDPRDRVRDVEPLLRGMRDYHEGRFAEAVEALTAASQVTDPSPHVWQFLGAALDALGRKSEAAEAYLRGSRHRASSAYLAETAALRLLELGRIDAALALLDDELARRSAGADTAMLHVLRSRALLRHGDPAAAATSAAQAVELDPQLADAYYQRAVVALSRRDGGAAVADLERATALDAGHLESRKALAMLRYSQGDRSAARRLLEEVLALDPADADARADLDRLAGEGGS